MNAPTKLVPTSARTQRQSPHCEAKVGIQPRSKASSFRRSSERTSEADAQERSELARLRRLEGDRGEAFESLAGGAPAESRSCRDESTYDVDGVVRW